MRLEATDGSVYVASKLTSTFGIGTSSQFSKQKTLKNTLNFGMTGDWVQVVSLLSNTFAITADTDYSMQLEATDGSVYVASKLTSTFGIGTSSQFSKQKTLKNATQFGMTGDWVQVTSTLTSTFGITGDTEYSMQLEATDGSVYVASKLSSLFVAGTSSQFSKQKTLKNTQNCGMTGDWVQVTSTLTSTFGITADTEYSMQLEATDGSVYVASKLTSTFGIGTSSQFSKQKTLKNTLNVGMTGGWVQVTSLLSNTFMITADTEYSMQLEATDGSVYVASKLTSTFGIGTSSQFSKQKTLKNTLNVGMTGGWVQVTSLLSNTFMITADTEYSMQLEATDGSVYVASKLTSTFGIGTSSQFSKQKTLKNTLNFGMTGDWVQVTSLLSNTFMVTGDTEYSMQLEATDGSVYVASKLTSTFGIGTSSQFSKQKTLKNTLNFGMTGDWVQVTSLLSNTFMVTGDTEYSMQLEATDGSVYVASKLTST